jgi:hypothetical protein
MNAAAVGEFSSFELLIGLLWRPMGREQRILLCGFQMMSATQRLLMQGRGIPVARVEESDN